MRTRANLRLDRAGRDRGSGPRTGALAATGAVPEVVGSRTLMLPVSEISHTRLRGNRFVLLIFVETEARCGHRIGTEGRDAA